MIKKIFLQQPDITIIDFIDGKTAKLPALTQRALQDIYENILKDVELLPELIDKELIWGVNGPSINIPEITNVFAEDDKYYLELEDINNQKGPISAEELKTIIFGLIG